MVVYITITFGRRNIRLKVEKIVSTTTTEKYKIIGRNKFFVLESNKGLLVGNGLKHRELAWKVTDGHHIKPFVLEKIITAIESNLGD